MKKNGLRLILIIIISSMCFIFLKFLDMKYKNDGLEKFSEKYKREIENPVFSVILPTYNRAAYLPRAITSVQGQTFTNFELIVVDDGSTDNTKEIVESFQEHDPRIIYIKSDRNYGVSHARNLALKAARGKYISILDSDDMFFQALLATEYKYLKEHEDIDVVTVRPYQLNDDGTVEKFERYETSIANPVMLLYDNEMVHVGSAIRRDFLVRNNIKYDETWHAAEDYKMWAEILMNGGHIEMIDQYLTAIRFHKTGKKSYYNAMNVKSKEVRDLLQNHYAPGATNPCDTFKRFENNFSQFKKNDVAKAKFFFCSGDYSGMYFIVEDDDGPEMIFVREDENSDRYCEINSNKCGKVLDVDEESITFSFDEDVGSVRYDKSEAFRYQKLR